MNHEFHTPNEYMRRPEVTWQTLLDLSPELAALDLPARAAHQVEISAKYWGYVRRQEQEVAKLAKVSRVRIPETFDYTACPQLRREAQDKLSRIKPHDLHLGVERRVLQPVFTGALCRLYGRVSTSVLKLGTALIGANESRVRRQSCMGTRC